MAGGWCWPCARRAHCIFINRTRGEKSSVKFIYTCIWKLKKIKSNGKWAGRAIDIYVQNKCICASFYYISIGQWSIAPFPRHKYLMWCGKAHGHTKNVCAAKLWIGKANSEHKKKCIDHSRQKWHLYYIKQVYAMTDSSMDPHANKMDGQTYFPDQAARFIIVGKRRFPAIALSWFTRVGRTVR